jgi:dihydrofolate reductase
MARLVYSALMSLDGYIEDAQGNFDWAAPDDEQHRFINDLTRPIGTHLYGRRMYETLLVWETDPSVAAYSEATADFARIWQAGEKVVYSRSLTAASTARTRIERRFDPEAVKQMKATLGQDILIGGPELAQQAIRAGLVDDYHLFVAPVVVGAGKRALPPDFQLSLELVETRSFGNGAVYLRYRAG